jgi:hypothetical protein
MATRLPSWVLLGLCVIPSFARAEDEPVSQNPYDKLIEEKSTKRMDLGVSGGWNNPGGVVGVEGEFRLNDYVGVGGGAGIGAWGARLTPQARLYPLGASARGVPIFIELGLAMNTGGKATFTENGTSYNVQQSLTPTVNGSFGMRKDIWTSAFVVFRVGYALSLSSPLTNYSVENGATLPTLSQAALTVAQPGGLILGAALGWSFL